jgi:hypothetical protein
MTICSVVPALHCLMHNVVVYDTNEHQSKCGVQNIHCLTYIVQTNFNIFLILIFDSCLIK